MCDIKNHSYNCRCYYCCKFIELHQNKLYTHNCTQFIDKNLHTHDDISINSLDQNFEQNQDDKSHNLLAENRLQSVLINNPVCTCSTNNLNKNQPIKSNIKLNQNQENNNIIQQQITQTTPGNNNIIYYRIEDVNNCNECKSILYGSQINKNNYLINNNLSTKPFDNNNYLTDNNLISKPFENKKKIIEKLNNEKLLYSVAETSNSDQMLFKCKDYQNKKNCKQDIRFHNKNDSSSNDSDSEQTDKISNTESTEIDSRSQQTYSQSQYSHDKSYFSTEYDKKLMERRRRKKLRRAQLLKDKKFRNE